MRSLTFVLIAFLAGSSIHFVSGQDNSLGRETLVVFNLNDPASEQLARYYGARRDIPDKQIIGLRCSTAEEISRDEYDATIADPLRRAFDSAGWWELRHPPGMSPVVMQNKIRFVALIRGMPLKVREKSVYSGDHPDPSTPYGAVNACSVDSELAALGRFTAQISGPINNPYFENFGRIDAIDLPQMMLVCRLDGPTADDVKRMIDDSIRAERSGLAGWVVLDERGTELPGYKMGDDWMKKAGSYFEKAGFPVFSETTEPILPSGLPLPRTAIYFGWYSENIAGAFTGDGPKFQPGAIACHIHSFSASTVHSTTSGWCGPLISAGTAATMGNVYEPYLVLTANLDIFSERLLRGFTFAESAWASVRAISWMNVAIGDPLYQPYANLATMTFPGDFAGYKASAATGVVDFRSGLAAEAWAQKSVRDGDSSKAHFLFEKALAKYSDAASLSRTAWSYSELLLRENKKSDALAILRKTSATIKSPVGSAFLERRIFELDPPRLPSATPAAAGKFIPDPKK